MKLQNLLFVRSCVPNRGQPAEQRNARTQKSKFIFISFCSEGALKSALHIKGCSNREEYHHRQKINHYPVIYRTVMVVCGKVAISTVSLASPPNGKVAGVLLRTLLHGRSPEQFFECYPCSLRRAANTLHDKLTLRKNEVFSMKSNLRNEIKSYIVRSGYTMQEVVDRLSEDYGWSDSVSNLSNKLQRESLRYVEAIQLADALGYDLVWQKRRDK